MTNIAGVKKCTRCGLDKNIDQFYARGNGYIVSECKVCTGKRVNIFSKTKNGKYVRAVAAAKGRKKTWTLSKEEYLDLLNLNCVYCDGFFDNDNSGIGLDRINNSLGYDLNNVMRCCAFCNYLRGDLLTPEETKALISLLITMRQSNIKKVS